MKERLEMCHVIGFEIYIPKFCLYMYMGEAFRPDMLC